MSDLQVFEFGGARVRTAGTHEAPLFCAADACAVLSIANVGNVLSRLKQNDIENIVTADVQGKNRGIAYVTEAGLYKLVMKSRKPEAEAFVDWITGEVLPAIRKQGYYSAIEAAQRQTTKQLLAACFPLAPAPAKPIFSDLISALLKMRNEPQVGNPAWAPLLAQIVYELAIPVAGQQPTRRALNGTPNGSHVDHAMFSPELKAHVLDVARGGIVLAKNSTSWGEWRARMETAYRNAPLQLALLTPIRRLPPKKAS